MNHIEFVQAGLHNRHIRFMINGKILQGVVVDDLFHTAGKSKRTHYTFIPTQNMVKWKEAEKNNDREMMTSLSSVIDIEEITWGMPVDGSDRMIREVELVQYLCELIKRKKDVFKNVVPEALLPGTNQYRVDILTERRQGNRWETVLIEVKSFSTFTYSKLTAAIEQLKVYERFSKGSKLVFMFPGILPDGDNKLIENAGIEVWDVNYISSFFAKEIANTPHPFLQSLFTKVNYSINEDKLVEELKSIRTGGKNENEWSRYQKFIQRILDHLFGTVLSSPITEHSDHFKINRRDFILRNYAETGFWSHLRSRYYADYIVVDAKNYSKKVTKKEVLQIANYLKVHGPGLFGLIFSRNGGDTSCYYTCREIWAMDKKLVIVLNDDDLEKMIIAKESSNNPEEIIRQRIEQFRLSM